MCLNCLSESGLYWIITAVQTYKDKADTYFQTYMSSQSFFNLELFYCNLNSQVTLQLSHLTVLKLQKKLQFEFKAHIKYGTDDEESFVLFVKLFHFIIAGKCYQIIDVNVNLKLFTKWVN